jgi:tetratricopeptide (TPR) repeat protein
MTSRRRNACRFSQAQTNQCTGRATLLFVLVAATCLRAQEPTRAASAPSKRLVVAILGLENQTGDPGLAHWRYAAGLLSSSLGQVRAIRVLSDGAVRYALRQVGLRPGDAIDPNHARAMGEQIEAQRVVWGSYAKKADLWQVRVRVMNVATGAISPEFSAEAGDWHDVRDKLNEQIRAELSITPSADEKKKAAKRETRSAEALDWCFRERLAEEQERPASEWEMLSRKAIAADPNCAWAYARLAATLATQGKSDRAEETAEKVLQLEPDSEEAHFVLGWLALAQRRLEQAEIQFRQACRLDPDNAGSLVYFASTLLEQGKPEEAGPLLEKAVSLDRPNDLAHACLAVVYALGKQPQEALRELEEARRYMPEGIRGGNTLSAVASAYERLGKRSEAIECYERLLPLFRRTGVGSDAVRQTERQIQRIKNILTPTFLQAPAPQRYTEEELTEIFRDKLTESERELVANPFACSDAMRLWAKELTRGAGPDMDKARSLWEALAARVDPRGPMKSRTAREVFEVWKNPEIRLVCMDYAVLFVALARVVGLDAFFANVTKGTDGTVFNHACGAVFLTEGVLLVDPALHWFGAPHQQYSILDDLQTSAFLRFNNKQGDPRELAACRAGLKLWPESVQGQLSLAGALWHTRRWEEARRVLAALDEPRLKDYEAARYWSCRGRVALEGQNWKEAEAYLLKAVSLYPGNYDAYYYLGSLSWEQRRWVEARTAFRACLRNDPDPVTAGIAQHYIAQINEEIGVDAASGTPTPEQ